MSDDQDGCEWVHVSSGTGPPGQSGLPDQRASNGCVCVCVCVCFVPYSWRLRAEYDVSLCTKVHEASQHGHAWQNQATAGAAGSLWMRGRAFPENMRADSQTDMLIITLLRSRAEWSNQTSSVIQLAVTGSVFDCFDDEFSQLQAEIQIYRSATVALASLTAVASRNSLISWRVGLYAVRQKNRNHFSLMNKSFNTQCNLTKFRVLLLLMNIINLSSMLLI